MLWAHDGQGLRGDDLRRRRCRRKGGRSLRNGVIAYHRWHQGGPGDDVVVVVNLSHLAHENYKLGLPSPGTWRLRLNSDWNGYSRGFGNQPCSDVVAGTEQRDEPQDPSAAERDGFPAAGTISIGPYSVLVFSQDKPASSERPVQK